MNAEIESDWLLNAIVSLKDRDPLDALHNVEKLLQIAKDRWVLATYELYPARKHPL